MTTLYTYWLSLIQPCSSTIFKLNSSPGLYSQVKSAESVILAMLSQTGESSHACYQLHDLLKSLAKEKNAGINGVFTVREILLLTHYVYAVLGDTIKIEYEQEQFLKQAFIDAMMAASSLLTIGQSKRKCKSRRSLDIKSF